MIRKNLAALACWIAALAALVVIFRAGHPVQAHLVHSDALYLPVLFDDLANNGGRFAHWFLTPAPYFFPDMPLYGIAWLVGDDVLAQTTMFALLQTAFAALALYLLARQALASSRLPAAAALSILFIWLGLNVDDPFVRLFASAHHYGAFVVALLVFAFWLGLESARARRIGYSIATIVLLTFLTTLSDALFLAHTAIPLLATALMFRHGAPRTTTPRFAIALLLAPALAGMLSYGLVVTNSTRYPTLLGLSQVPQNLHEMGSILATLFDARPVLAAALLLSLGLGTACILAGLRRCLLPGMPRVLHLLAAFATLSCLATVSAMLLSKNVLPVPRYLIGALSWPLIAGLFALVHMLDARVRHAGPGLCLALSVAFSGLLVGEAWRVRDVRDTGRYYYPEQIACIDRTLAGAGAAYGMAQYWDAKRLQALSHKRLTLAQYTGELDRMEWITSKRFYRAEYGFAIIAESEPAQFKLSHARLVAFNGEPAREVACGDRTVLLYPPGRLRVPPSVSAR